jgi:antirestriction protein ArdC
VQVHDGGDQACYIPSLDCIHMPEVKQFKEGHKGYAQTFAHECIHATGAKSRLGRKLDGGFGYKDYAREELVAEIGAAMIMANTGTDLNEDQCVAYLKSWLKACDDDATALNYGATRAEKAAAMILGTTEEAATSDQKEEVVTA